MTVEFNENSRECLAKYVEQISDDFQSTFTVVNENTLANMMGFPGDFVNIEKIVRRYLPSSQVTFHKTNKLGEDAVYDIYLMQDLSDAERGR